MKINEYFNGRGTRHYVSSEATDLAGMEHMVLAIAEATGCQEHEVLIRSSGGRVVAEFTVYDRKGHKEAGHV